MTKEEIRQKIKAIVIDQLCLEKGALLTDQARFTRDLGADALDIVDMITEIEEEFDIDIPDADIKKLPTINETVDYVFKKKDR
ncbi:MAG: acyl carrier protein [Patescibacteria group bacterium]